MNSHDNPTTVKVFFASLWDPRRVFPRGNILSLNILHTKRPSHATKELEGIFNKNDATLVHKFQLVTHLNRNRRLYHSNHIWPANWVAKVVLIGC
jgi:hypothetical protein